MGLPPLDNSQLDVPGHNRMHSAASRTIAYVAFAAFCLLSSVRDVISEIFFKNRLYEASPVFVLFVYGAVAQLIAAAFFFAESSPGELRKISFRSMWKELLWLNVFTLSAWIFYYLAIATPLGAALTSFVEYGSGPIFLAIVGVLVAGEPIKGTFAWSATASLAGIAILAAPRFQLDNVSWPWILGLSLALLTGLSSAFYRVCFKLLLEIGLAKSAIVFLRLIGMTLFLGAYLCFRPDKFRGDLLLPLAVVGALTFALPLFLMLTVLRRIPIVNYAMLLFCVPATTYILAGLFGYGSFFASDLIGITVYEFSTRPRT
jgi:drug/metabolite transporter (DMT)-like permease